MFIPIIIVLFVFVAGVVMALVAFLYCSNPSNVINSSGLCQDGVPALMPAAVLLI